MPRDPEGGAQHAWRAKWLAAKLLDPCRQVARQAGYALAEHGSKNRDIDWIAVPWVEDCGSPTALVDALIREIGRTDMAICTVFHSRESESYGSEEWECGRNGRPGDKPHGRLTWTIHLGGGPYIDLSVMPPQHKETAR